MVRGRKRPTNVLPGVDNSVGWRHALVQASVLGTFVASTTSTSLVTLPALVFVCYLDARLAPIVPLAAIVYVVAHGMSFAVVPPLAGAIAGVAASPWALAATTLWAVVVATAIFTLVTLQEPLWVAAVVGVVAAGCIAGAFYIGSRRPAAVAPDIEQGAEKAPEPPPTPRRKPAAQSHLFL